MTTQTPAPGIIPYQVNAELWSDGAAKTRFLALPGTSQIDFDQEGPWDFPPNTVTVKNFFLDLEVGNPDSRRIVETRLLVKRATGPLWDGYSYQWNEDGTDAVLLQDSATQSFTITDPQAPGGSRTHVHYFPSRRECGTCHTPAAGFVLGLNTAQLNRRFDYDGVIDNQLRSFNHIGLFTANIGSENDAWPRLEDPFGAADLDQRARSYLAANCSQCHRPGSTGRADLDLRFTTPLKQTGALNEEPILDDFGLDEPLLINPGLPENSVLYRRLLDLGEARMPPLATQVVDSKGAELIRAWIEDLDLNTSIADAPSQPDGFALRQNAPNPFNSGTVIRFDLPQEGRVVLAVYNLAGQRVATLLNGHRAAGAHVIAWNGRDATGRDLATGVYVYQVQVEGFTAQRKLVLLR